MTEQLAITVNVTRGRTRAAQDVKTIHTRIARAYALGEVEPVKGLGYCGAEFTNFELLKAGNEEEAIIGFCGGDFHVYVFEYGRRIPVLQDLFCKTGEKN